MSFVEKNKAWLLPVLGVGVAAVIYGNLRSSAPPPPPPPPPAVAAPLLQAPVAAPPATAGSGGELWSDLLALAKPPEALVQEAGLRERCRENLNSLLEPPAKVTLGRPGWVREAEPVKAPAPPASLLAPVDPAPPLVDFVMSGPAGAEAWIQGRAYRAGDTLAGGRFKVLHIDWNRVSLQGPKGVSTHLVLNRPFSSPAATRPSAEAP